MDAIMRKALQSDERDTLESVRLEAYTLGVAGSGQTVVRGDLSDVEWDRFLTRLMESVAQTAAEHQMWN